MSFGRLERASGHQPMSDINVTPLVDVMLVLVVIFILTAPLLVSSVQLDLPRTEAKGSGTTETPVLLTVNAQGLVFLNNQLIGAPELTQALAQLAQSRPDAEVQLRADTNVPYGRVAEVMAAAQTAGLHRMAFVTETPSPSLAPMR